MSESMLTRRVLSGCLLLASLAAAAPVARWCPLRWDQVALASFLECASRPRPALPVACPRVDRCAAAPSCPESPAACGAGTACPLRDRIASQATAADRTDGPAAAPVPARRHKGRAYCLDEPGMATAFRGHSPTPDPPAVIATLVPTLEAPGSVRISHPVADARPPTAPARHRPPIRGPPPLLG